MKTKTVTIHNWDGSKYDVEAPAKARYVTIMSHTGIINFYTKKPKLKPDGYYFCNERMLEEGIRHACPEDNLPYRDGYGAFGSVIIKGIHASEMLLKIEEV